MPCVATAVRIGSSPDVEGAMSPRDISPVIIELVIEPRSKGDQEKLDAAIRRLAEDVSFLSAHVEEESGRTVLGGTGEEHLKVLVARLKGEFEVEADFGEPRVAYRETIRKAVEDQEYVHKKQTGGTGEFAKVRLTIEPMEGDKSPYEFVNEVTGGRLPKEFAEAVDAGVQEAMKYGVLAYYEMTGIRVILVDADYREVESSELAFKTAGCSGLQGGRAQGFSRAPRADDGRRGHHARGLRERRHRRHQRTPRPDPGHGRGP